MKKTLKRKEKKKKKMRLGGIEQSLQANGWANPHLKPDHPQKWPLGVVVWSSSNASFRGGSTILKAIEVFGYSKKLA